MEKQRVTKVTLRYKKQKILSVKVTKVTTSYNKLQQVTISYKNNKLQKLLIKTQK